MAIDCSILLFLVFLLTPTGRFGFAFGATFGDSCRSNYDCLNTNTYCEVVSPTCGSGTCLCLPGYTLDAAQCKQQRFYQEACDPTGASTACVGLDNLECTKGGLCDCSSGFRFGPIDSESYGCIPETTNVTREMQCFDNIQCLFGMKCERNLCQCQAWQKPVGPYACAKRQLGDGCQTDDNCAANPNSVCAKGTSTCICAPNAGLYRYLDDSGNIKQVCMSAPAGIAFNNKTTLNLLGAERQNCNIWESRGPLFPCRLPYMCTFCSVGRTICARASLSFNAGTRTTHRIHLAISLFPVILAAKYLS